MTRINKQKKPNQTHNLFIVLKNKLFVVVVAFIQLGRQQAHHIYICINIKKSKQVNRVGGENEPNNLKRMVGERIKMIIINANKWSINWVVKTCFSIGFRNSSVCIQEARQNEEGKNVTKHLRTYFQVCIFFSFFFKKKQHLMIESIVEENRLTQMRNFILVLLKEKKIISKFSIIPFIHLLMISFYFSLMLWFIFLNFYPFIMRIHSFIHLRNVDHTKQTNVYP